jgi:hypothetical protein
VNGVGWDYGQGPFSMQQRSLATRLRDMQDLDGYSGRDRGRLSRFEELDDPVGNSILPKNVPLY